VLIEYTVLCYVYNLIFDEGRYGELKMRK
jgi:hypothetical protein